MANDLEYLPSLLGTRYSPMINTPDVTDHIHNGLAYEVSGYSTSTLATGNSFIFTGTTGDIPVHFHSFMVNSSTGPLLIKLIEDPTINVAGTPTTPQNKNRNSTKASTMAVTQGASITGGTVIASRMILSTSQGHIVLLVMEV